eukprot:scaffold281748_cov18-Tisochrysis_lutea.AAC.1
MEAKRELEAEKTQKEALLERQDHTLVSENLKPTALHSDGLNGPIWHDITLCDTKTLYESFTDLLDSCRIIGQGMVMFCSRQSSHF